MDSMRLLRIVPTEPLKDGFQKTQGTKVLTPSGEEIKGVTGITIRFNSHDIVRATIECMVVAPEVSAATSVYVPRPSWWRRALIRLAGGQLDVTSLQSTEREWDSPR